MACSSGHHKKCELRPLLLSLHWGLTEVKEVLVYEQESSPNSCSIAGTKWYWGNRDTNDTSHVSTTWKHDIYIQQLCYLVGLTIWKQRGKTSMLWVQLRWAPASEILALNLHQKRHQSPIDHWNLKVRGRFVVWPAHDIYACRMYWIPTLRKPPKKCREISTTIGR